MQLKIINRRNINETKYIECLDKMNAPIYPYPWFLDIVTFKNWDALVLDDYDCVMPLPYIKSPRTFYRKVYGQPAFCQQLGIFAKHKITQEKVDRFLGIFLKLNPENYNFNVSNSEFLISRNHFHKSSNYFLPLNVPYQEIYRKFYNSKKGHVKKVDKKYESKVAFHKNMDAFIDFKLNNSKHNTDYKKPKNKKKLTELIKNENVKIANLSVENRLITSTVLIYFKNRVYDFSSVSSEEGRLLSGRLYLLNDLFKKHSNQELVFDFYGSDEIGLQNFYKEIGGENETFYQYTKKRN